MLIEKINKYLNENEDDLAREFEDDLDYAHNDYKGEKLKKKVVELTKKYTKKGLDLNKIKQITKNFFKYV
jgi:hypothetical protein